MADTTLRPGLSLFDSLTLVVGCTIGSGIFIVSAGIAREVRTPALMLLVWILASVMSLFGALTVAELAAMMPAAGGHYVFLREAYGGLCSFLFGWTIIAVIHTGSIAAVAIVFAKYLGVLLPAAVHSHFNLGIATIPAERLIAIALIVVLTVGNVCGLQVGRGVQNLFTIVKVAAIVLIVLFALVIAPNHAALQANFGSRRAFFGAHGFSLAILPAFGAAMIGALFSLGGADNLIAVGAEVRNPGRSLPIALISGASLVIVLYLLINCAYLAQLPVFGDPAAPATFARGISGAQSGRVAAATMEMIWGRAGAALIALLVMVSTLGCLNGFILGGGRLVYAMAHDRVFFRIATRLNSASVPAIALVIQAVWGSILVLSGDFSDLLNYMGGAGSLFGILTATAIFVLRIKRPAAARPYRAWGYPFIPAISLAASTAILIDLVVVKPRYCLLGLLIVCSGTPLYLWRKRQIRNLEAGTRQVTVAFEPKALGNPH
jgi:basic amino acid/polyamine antiporter, APA family